MLLGAVKLVDVVFFVGFRETGLGEQTRQLHFQ